MKIGARQAEAFVRSPDPNVCAILVYGPDAGLVSERATTLLAGCGVDLDDPFRIVSLRGEEIVREPGRLADEAAAIPLGGGQRIVRGRDVTDAAADSVEYFFERPIGGVFIVLEAGDLGPRSRLRRLFEGADQGAALPCFLDDEITRESVIEQGLREHGLSIERNALTYLSSHLSGDRGLVRRELEKLALFVSGEPGPVTLAQSSACIGDESKHVLDDVANAATAGQTADLAKALDRCMAAGERDISVLRALSRHLQRLHAASAARDGGESIDTAIAGLRPPIFFKQKAAFAAQLRSWTTVRLGGALEVALDAERSCKSTGTPGNLICERTLFQIASGARRQ